MSIIPPKHRQSQAVFGHQLSYNRFMQKVLLYYKFIPITDPLMLKLWQKTLCDSLNLRGRIIVSEQGINGTVGGDIDDLKAYVRSTKEFSGFKDILWKWSEGGREDFPRMSVKVKPELVAFDSYQEIKVDEKGVVGGGPHLKPHQVNEMVEKYGDDVVFFDGRNKYEAAVGRFKNTVVPDTRTSRDFIPELESGKYDNLKRKKVITYCTGGVRCELLSAMMRQRGFEEVYQIDGGIVKYGEAYGDDGLWEGQLYVFDGRMGVNFSDSAKTLGSCTHCRDKTSHYINCAESACNELVLVCERCDRDPRKRYHTEKCENKHTADKTR